MNREQLISIIDDAVNREDDSYTFYKDAAGKAEDPQTKSLFERLSKEELKHKDYLQKFLETKAETIKIDDSEDYNLSQDIDRPRMTTEMNFTDAIKLAIKREEEAMQLYADIANSCLDKAEQDIFAGLSKMEKLHKTELEEIFLNVGFNEVW